ncbi:hypothetical protein FHS93_002878 [Sphingobium francense]|nr:hypothetical protein [Sphingobium indicum]
MPEIDMAKGEAVNKGNPSWGLMPLWLSLLKQGADRKFL